MAYDLILPENPIDGHEVNYFSIAYDRVQPCRLKYHERATWREVCGGDERGADFVDEWQVFEDGRFIARITGWDIAERFRGDKEVFECCEQAKEILRQRLLRRAASYEKQAKQCRDKVAELMELAVTV